MISPPPAWTSPVAAYTVAGVPAQMPIAPTARDGSSCQSGNHVSPPSMDLWTPPEAAPAYMISGFAGWIASARTRPPTLRGPVGIQLCCAPANAGPATAAARRGARPPAALVAACPAKRTAAVGAGESGSDSATPWRKPPPSYASFACSGASNWSGAGPSSASKFSLSVSDIRYARSRRKRTAVDRSAFVGWKERPSRVATVGVYGIGVVAVESAVTSVAMRSHARQSGIQPIAAASGSPAGAGLW